MSEQIIYLGTSWKIRGRILFDGGGIPYPYSGDPQDPFSYADLVTDGDPQTRPEFLLINSIGAPSGGKIKLLGTAGSRTYGDGNYLIFDDQPIGFTVTTAVTPTLLSGSAVKRTLNSIDYDIGAHLVKNGDTSLTLTIKPEANETHSNIYMMIHHTSASGITQIQAVIGATTVTYNMSARSDGIYLIYFPNNGGRVAFNVVYTKTTNGTADVIGIFSTNKNLSSSNPTCFLAGTLIKTPDGNKPIETLKVGDLILTQSKIESDIIIKPISYIQITQQIPNELKKESCCFCIKKGLFNGLPSDDLFCTYPHILYTPEPKYAFQVGEYYNIDHVITYYHIMTDALEIMFANNLPVETLGLSHKK